MVMQEVAPHFEEIFQLINIKHFDRTIRKNNTAAFLWPLIKDDWRKSISGVTAIQNIIYSELFDVTLQKLPRQRMGLYLYEGQEWEQAFIHAWRKHGHDRPVGQWQVSVDRSGDRFARVSGRRRFQRSHLLHIAGQWFRRLADIRPGLTEVAGCVGQTLMRLRFNRLLRVVSQ